jgi:hypothetical protein
VEPHPSELHHLVHIFNVFDVVPEIGYDSLAGIDSILEEVY